MEQIETVEPLEYTDRYTPSKLGLIFSERIFVGDLTYATFCMNLVRNTGKQEQ